MSKTAVVLMNLGGPDSAAAVEPFLFNLFSDPAIITLPNPLRWLIAKTIAKRRGPVAREIYAKIGHASPLLPNTDAQLNALEAELRPDHRCFIAMRYWSPRAEAAAVAVKEWGAEKVILLPLYPQFSSTTTASSLKDWQQAAAAVGLTIPTRAICCYPMQAGFVAALAENIRTALEEWPKDLAAPRILLSAHGLPKRTVARGDPYEAQVTQTASQLRQILNRSVVDAIVCYQSRVGPLEWLGPATDAEIKRAGREKQGLVVAPIAFVSEHSETLVELDIEYGHLAKASGVPHYVRVPTVSAASSFIAGLAALVRQASEADSDRPWPDGGQSHCPGPFPLCPLQAAR